MSISAVLLRFCRVVSLSAAACLSTTIGCSSGGDAGNVAGAPAVGNAGTTSGAGTSPGAGGSLESGGGSAGTAAVSGSGGQSAVPMGGSGGAASGGESTGGSGAGTAAGGGGAGGAAAGVAGTGGGGGSGGLEDGDTPPWRPLNVIAAVGEHVHGKAGLDTRAAKMLGKLVVDVGVNSGGYSSYLAKRGYHSIGAPCGSCPAPNLGGGRDEVGNCRLQEFATTEAYVKDQLTMLQAQYPEEDWGYFLNQDGSVRWSDVAITGISHGATTAALAGRIGARMWRVVSRSGPRDNTCGLGNGQCTLPLSTPSYDTNCPDSDVASWLDQPSKTPMNRFYALVGTTDGQCGDIMFNMHRTQYLGVPTIWNEGTPDLSGTNQFFSTQGGHYDFLAAPTGVPGTPKVLDIAFGIPPENQDPNF